jgi:hypothetical protein
MQQSTGNRIGSHTTTAMIELSRWRAQSSTFGMVDDGTLTLVLFVLGVLGAIRSLSRMGPASLFELSIRCLVLIQKSDG